MLPQATADHYRRQQRLAVTTIAANRRAWSAMTDDFDASWRVVSPRLSLITSAGQLAAAQAGVNYLPEVLAETGQIDRPAATVVARAFAGVAADGRPLDSMLYGAVTNAMQAVAQGVPTVEALARGGRWLDMATQTTIADASRSASGVGIVVRPDIDGYVRMVNMPSCKRCIVLASKFFRWNKGFQRHPRCDCSHIPASENIADDFTTSPSAAFNHLTEAQQNAVFGRADAAAIREGANIGQVVNANRGTYTTAEGLRATREGTTNRGLAGNSGVTTRLTPEQIYRTTSNRDEALALLRANGYVR